MSLKAERTIRRMKNALANVGGFNAATQALKASGVFLLERLGSTARSKLNTNTRIARSVGHRRRPRHRPSDRIGIGGTRRTGEQATRRSQPDAVNLY